MRSPDEILLMRAMLEQLAHIGDRAYLRELAASQDMPVKRSVGIAEKWEGKGWYEYGVTVDLGWLTAEGVAALMEVVAAEDRAR